MTQRLRSESGFVLLGAMLVLIIMMGIGLAIVSLNDTQQNLSGKEHVQESSFDLAEAALNAAALQLGRTWPTSTSPATLDCDPTTSGTSYCPLSTAITNGYTTQDYASACPTNGSAKLWQTQIRDNTNGSYWSTAINSAAHYDANADNSVWVRSFATVQCKTVSIVALVSYTATPIPVSKSVITANFFTTSNQGKKVIIDTRGVGSQPAAITLRCATGAPSPCANYAASKGQVQPPTVTTSSTTATQMLSAIQLQSLEQQAASAGSLWTTGSCPTTAAQLASPAAGVPVVVQGPCNISITGNGTMNSAASPGALIIENGTLTLGGTTTFYGYIYMVNKQASSGSILTIQGNATVQGAVSVDGNGGITAGSSKTNLIYDPAATTVLKGSTGATIGRGTLRTLPASTP
jgi:Tfp pilus assembly protein PilX